MIIKIWFYCLGNSCREANQLNMFQPQIFIFKKFRLKQSFSPTCYIDVAEFVADASRRLNLSKTSWYQDEKWKHNAKTKLYIIINSLWIDPPSAIVFAERMCLLHLVFYLICAKLFIVFFCCMTTRNWICSRNPLWKYWKIWHIPNKDLINKDINSIYRNYMADSEKKPNWILNKVEKESKKKGRTVILRRQNAWFSEKRDGRKSELRIGGLKVYRDREIERSGSCSIQTAQYDT